MNERDYNIYTRPINFRVVGDPPSLHEDYFTWLTTELKLFVKS